jgi:hypothetical protein
LAHEAYRDEDSERQDGREDEEGASLHDVVSFYGESLLDEGVQKQWGQTPLIGSDPMMGNVERLIFG